MMAYTYRSGVYNAGEGMTTFSGDGTTGAAWEAESKSKQWDKVLNLQIQPQRYTSSSKTSLSKDAITSSFGTTNWGPNLQILRNDHEAHECVSADLLFGAVNSLGVYTEK